MTAYGLCKGCARVPAVHCHGSADVHLTEEEIAAGVYGGFVCSCECRQIVKAPWTPEQVKALTRYQALGWAHPYTCGPCRDTDVATMDPDCPQVLVNDHLLVPTEAGWICPTCDYTQDWAVRVTTLTTTTALDVLKAL